MSSEDYKSNYSDCYKFRRYGLRGYVAEMGQLRKVVCAFIRDITGSDHLVYCGKSMRPSNVRIVIRQTVCDDVDLINLA
jgi:hypothetical protein